MAARNLTADEEEKYLKPIRNEINSMHVLTCIFLLRQNRWSRCRGLDQQLPPFDGDFTMTIKDYLNNLKNSPRPETNEDRKKSAAALIDILLQEVSTPPEYEIIPEIEEWLIDICRMDRKDTLSTIDKYHFLALPTIIDMYDIVSIPSQKKYAIRNLDGAVSEYDFPALSSQFPHEISGRNKSGFDRMLKNSNRQKQKIVYRIPTNVKPIPPTEYNALNLKFLQPKLGPNPWFIDLVIKTLTGGEPGGAESMTRTILRKYRHPADRQIPWFVFSDNGGTGKGLLFEKILTKIFGRNVSNHNLSFDKISGRFSDLKGLLCALINEAPPHRTDLNFLKSIVWESEYIGEEKYQKQEVIDLYIWGGITSNPRNNRPTIMPTGNDEDRRWSFYCPDPACNTLLVSLKQHFELDSIDEARLWLSDNISEHTNEDHVAGHPQQPSDLACQPRL
jgi:hypothetical protein